MHYVALHEVKVILEMLWRGRNAADLGAFVAATLEGLKRLIPCDLVSYNEVDAASRAVRTTTLPATRLPEGADAVIRHQRDHPLFALHLRTRDGRSRRLTDVGTLRVFRGARLFSELYRPARLGWEMAMTLPATAGHLRCVALNRDARDFSERDLQLLEMIRPYLSEAQRDVDAADRVRLLSQRERDVLTLVAGGKTNTEIAAALHVSSRTVQKHLEHIYDKIGVRRRAGAAGLLSRRPRS